MADAKEEQQPEKKGRLTDPMRKLIDEQSEVRREQRRTNELLERLLARLAGPGTSEGEGQAPESPAPAGGEPAPDAGAAGDSIPAPPPKFLPPLAPASLEERASAVGPFEDVLVRYASGVVQVFPGPDDALYVVMHCQLRKLSGEWDGTFQTVIRLDFPLQPVGPLYEFPRRQGEDYERPDPYILNLADLHNNRLKARWTFADGSTIEAVGTSLGYLIPFKGSSNEMAMSAALVITYGTKQFQGVQGSETFAGGTWFPAQPLITPGKGYEHRSLHQFRLFRQEYQGKPPE